METKLAGVVSRELRLELRLGPLAYPRLSSNAQFRKQAPSRLLPLVGAVSRHKVGLQEFPHLWTLRSVPSWENCET